MRVKSFTLKGFRRFSDLQILDIPQSARLVVLAGPNGNGKSSLFDAFLSLRSHHVGHGGWEPDYHNKISYAPEEGGVGHMRLEFHDAEFRNDRESWRKAFYFRTAYRNEPDFRAGNFSQQQKPTEELRFHRLIDNDATVNANYQRLVLDSLEDIYERESGGMTIHEYRLKIIGKLRASISTIFPELHLDGLGNPLDIGTFRFSKGISTSYTYKNLSGGEKAAFDLVLDLIIKQKGFIDSIICIDEPEAHLNARVHGRLLDALLDLIEPPSQLWIATHSIGMMRRARDLEINHPGSVAVIDFDADFDQPQVLRPLRLDRAFWQRSLEVALDDLAALVAPKQIIACEGGAPDGSPGVGVDSAIYNQIFEFEFPETRFVSVGASTDVRGDKFLVVQAVAGLIDGTSVMRLIDRDGMSDPEVADHEARGIRVLSRQIESYMFDDEVLDLLCDRIGQSDKREQLRGEIAGAIAAAQANGHAPDDIKKAAGRIADACRRVLKLKNAGHSSNAFMRDTLAPLISPETEIYKELKRDIFG